MKVARNWNELTVGQYQDLHPTFSKEYNNPVDKVIEQLMILTGASIQDVEKLTLDDLNEFQEDLKFLSEPLDERLRLKFRIKGVKYRFEVDANKLTGGAYMSAMHLAEKDPNTKLHQVLFNIAKPINLFGKDKKVDTVQFYEDHVDDFKDLPMSIAYPIVSFFFRHWKVLINDIADYSSEKLMMMNEMLKEVNKDLEKDLAG